MGGSDWCKEGSGLNIKKPILAEKRTNNFQVGFISSIGRGCLQTTKLLGKRIVEDTFGFGLVEEFSLEANVVLPLCNWRW